MKSATSPSRSSRSPVDLRSQPPSTGGRKNMRIQNEAGDHRPPSANAAEHLAARMAHTTMPHCEPPPSRGEDAHHTYQ